MPILTDDIKLLKSAVMADVSEGGGAMTGIALIDGQSNNLLPDTSSMDRAFGRVAARKLFAVAHSDDTDTLLGAHAMVTDAPDDPLVHCTLIQTSGWADTRTEAKETIERYLVKGPRLAYRLWDTHYAGSMIIQLVSMVDATPPAAGDAVVLVNPDDEEQFVRILKVTNSVQQIAVVEGGGTVLISARVASCTLGNTLSRDFFGPPAQRVGLDEDAYTKVFSSSVSSGAKFFGIKPLAADGEIGDLSIMATDGIYTPAVPAATVESPLVDQYPLLTRGSLSRTAIRTVAFSASVNLSAGSVLLFPTAMEPGSVTLNHGGVVLSDDGSGNLRQGADTVGELDYRGKRLTITIGAFGVATSTVTYKAATQTGAATHSAGTKVTIANQGLVYTEAFEPPPAPGTMTASFMAQGRWYELGDNGNGKLAGSDNSHGTGNLNYTTGSLGITLGAIPDIDSTIIYQWGNATTAKGVTAELPSRLHSLLYITSYTAKMDTLTLEWSRGATNYSATCSAEGVLSGDATGTVRGASYNGGYALEVQFSPAVTPVGAITANWTNGGVASTIAVGLGGGDYTLAEYPAAPGSLAFQVGVNMETAFDLPASIYVVDNAAGFLIAPNHGNAVIGTVNYTTGAVHVNATVPLDVYERVVTASTSFAGGTRYFEDRTLRDDHVTSLRDNYVTAIAHRAAGSAGAGTQDFSPTEWRTVVPRAAGTLLHTDAVVLTVGDDLYYSTSGTLSRGWNPVTGAPITVNAGTVSSEGVISITEMPSNGSNAVLLGNAGVNAASGLTVGKGIFRISSAPVKVGVFQIQAGALVGVGDDEGEITGNGWAGLVDYQRGIVEWNRTVGYTTGYGSWTALDPVLPEELSYNAVYLQYLPLDAALLGLDTVRLPLDGKVPIFRPGDLLVVHNTLTTQLPNPLVKGTVYELGRERIASVRVRDALGEVVTSDLYVSDLDPGTLTVPVPSDITGYTQPFTVEHRIEDLLLCAQADISGQIKVTRGLTHDFPADTSFISSALPFGDMFARVYGDIEQVTWTGEWSDELIGDAPLANFNDGLFPIVVTNRGAITERWALIFTSSSAFSIVGEHVGVIGTGSTGADCAPINPATGAPYFTIPEGGWGSGWSLGNVLRRNTVACGAPFWVIRTVLQGPASLESDVFSIAFRSDIDRP